MKEWIAPGDGETYNRCHFWCVDSPTSSLIGSRFTNLWETEN